MDTESTPITIELHLSDGSTAPITGTYHDHIDAEPSESITELWLSIDHDELDALIQEVASTDSEDDFDAAKAYSEVKATLDRNYQSMLEAGVTEEELAGMTIGDLLNAPFVAEKLQSTPGNGPVGDELVAQLRGGARKGQTVRGKSAAVTAILSGLTSGQVRQITQGTREVSVNEAAQLAVAYGITTGELLGILDADEVKLLALFRSGSEEQRKALLTVLGPWVKGEL